MSKESKKNKSHFRIKRTTLYALLILGIVVLLPFALLFSYWGYYADKIYPNIEVNSVGISGLDKEEAQETLLGQFKPHTIFVYTPSEEFSIEPEAIGLSYDYSNTVENAYLTNRSGNLLERIVSSSSGLINTQDVPLVFKYDEKLFDESLAIISTQATTPPVYPTVLLNNSRVEVEKGSPGTEVNIPMLKSMLLENIENGVWDKVAIPVKTVDPSITDDVANQAKTRGENLITKTLSFEFERKTFDYTREDILALIDPSGGYKQDAIDGVINELAVEVERKAQNPVFDMKDGKVHEFIPAKTGVEINRATMTVNIQNALSELETSDITSTEIEIVVSETEPEISTGEVNDLGIKELIGRGSSRYAHSIASRIHNIGVASSKFNGVLIKPGETISFNNIVGDISILTGYKQAYVISGGKTVLGDGGGVCQVSTTLFRAMLDAGLPITERRPHSYRVTYYEQDSKPGLDATIYSPTTDLKALNDTPGHLLIQSYYDPKAMTLDFEIYGTSDGRVSTITEPIITSQTPPPPDEYTDDPNLPEGTVEQVDWATWGAKVNFSYTVERDGETIFDKTFYSNYQAWSNKFLRGTGPAQ